MQNTQISPIKIFQNQVVPFLKKAARIKVNGKRIPFRKGMHG